MKKKIIILIIFLLSFFSSSIDNSIINNVEIMVPLLFTLLGLCFTGYTFIYTPVIQIISKAEETNIIKNKLTNLLNSFEEDMSLIFFLSIIIIILDFSCLYDIPILKNVYDLDLGVIYIKSLKNYIINFFISTCSYFSFYSLYDIMNASFKILKGSLEKK